MTRAELAERLRVALRADPGDAEWDTATVLDTMLAIRDAAPDGPAQLAEALGLAAEELTRAVVERRGYARIVRAKEKP